MAIVTTYVCDVSGKQGTNKEEFVSVRIASTTFDKQGSNSYKGVEVTKLISKEVALKFSLIAVPKTDTPTPEVTFESKLSTLLTDYISNLVYDEVQSAVDNR